MNASIDRGEEMNEMKKNYDDAKNRNEKNKVEKEGNQDGNVKAC